jgi:hypothetical protein
MTNAELREKELAVVEHMKHGWHDGCQCEPCIAVREIVKEAQAQATPQGQRSDGQILLWKFGFQSVLCGFDGKSFYYCKECQFYEEGHNHKTGLTKETVRHKPDCMLEGALRVSAPAQAQGTSQDRLMKATLSDERQALLCRIRDTLTAFDGHFTRHAAASILHSMAEEDQDWKLATPKEIAEFRRLAAVQPEPPAQPKEDSK